MSKNNENIGAAAGSVPLEQENKVIAENNAAVVTEKRYKALIEASHLLKNRLPTYKKPFLVTQKQWMILVNIITILDLQMA